MKWTAKLLAAAVVLVASTVANADDLNSEIGELQGALQARVDAIANLPNPSNAETKERSKLQTSLTELGKFTGQLSLDDFKALQKAGKQIGKSKTQDATVHAEALDVVGCLPAAADTVTANAAGVIAQLDSAGNKNAAQKQLDKGAGLIQQALALLGANDKKAESKLYKALKKLHKGLSKANKALKKQLSGGRGAGGPLLRGIVNVTDNVHTIRNEDTRRVFIRSLRWEFDVYRDGQFVKQVTGNSSQFPEFIGDQVAGYGVAGMRPGDNLGLGEMILAVMLPFQPAQTIRVEGKVLVKASYQRSGGKSSQVGFPVHTGDVPF